MQALVTKSKSVRQRRGIEWGMTAGRGRGTLDGGEATASPPVRTRSLRRRTNSSFSFGRRHAPPALRRTPGARGSAALVRSLRATASSPAPGRFLLELGAGPAAHQPLSGKTPRADASDPE